MGYKRYKKSPLIVSRNGKIVEIPPEEIPPTTKYLRFNDDGSNIESES